MEWKSDNLENLLDAIIDYRGKTPTKTSVGIPLVTAKIIKNGVINEFNEFIAEEDYDRWMVRGFPKPGDVVLTTEAPLGEVAQLDERKIALAQRVVCLRGKSNILDNTYLKYYFLSNYGKKKLKSRESGTTVTGIKQSELRQVEVRYPSFENQKRIASILSSLDDKIAVNRRICENLEAQAQALFKNWFVDFAPFKDGKFVESELGLIPEGWRVVSLAELMDYSGGSQPPASEFIDEEREGYVRFVQIRDYATDSHITYIPESKKNKLCDVKDIMIARYGVSLGRICYGLKGAYNVALAKVFPTKDYYLEFLRCYLNTMEFYKGINMKGNRAVQAGFNKSDIQSFKLPFPNDESIVSCFNDICSTLFEKRLSNEQESRRLATLRDTLLPKLMSGEIKI